MFYILSDIYSTPSQPIPPPAVCSLRRDEHVNINLSWGLDSILSRESLRDSSAVDKLRDGLQNDFYAALRQAYFGPALPLDDEVEGGRLPKFFEADERSVMENPEVIQLVFGREVLGCVRERKPRRLPSRTPGAPRFPRMRMNPQESIQDSKKDSLAKAPLHTNDTMRKNKQSTVTMNSSVNEVEDDLVLDFIMGGESLATAVRFAQSPRMQMERDVKESSGVVFHRASFYKNEALVALLVEDVDEDVDAAATARRCVKLVTPEGRHTHTVLRSTTPLVRHLDFLNAGGNICVAQARRAWLPPSNLWLFKPRSYAHDTGGWSIEWAGHARQRHPAWLDPHVMVLMVALHTIEHELGGRQPQGVFGREGGTLGWLWSMLHFH